MEIVLEKGGGHWKDAGAGVYVTARPVEGAQAGYLAQDGLRMFRYATLAELRADRHQARRAWFFDTKTRLLHVRTGAGDPDGHAYHLARHEYGLYLDGSQHVIVRGFEMRHYGGAAVRLAVQPSGCSGHRYRLEVGEIRTGDAVFESGGVRIAVDPLSLPFVHGTRIALVQEGLSRRLRFDNPNARQSCGCGESFGV